MPAHQTQCSFSETALQVYHSYLFAQSSCMSVATNNYIESPQQYDMISQTAETEKGRDKISRDGNMDEIMRIGWESSH